jgi:hypothetical protein
VTDGIAHWGGDRWRGPEQLNLRVVFPHLDEFQPVMWDTLPELEEKQFPTPANHAEGARISSGRGRRESCRVEEDRKDVPG